MTEQHIQSCLNIISVLVLCASDCEAMYLLGSSFLCFLEHPIAGLGLYDALPTPLRLGRLRSRAEMTAQVTVDVAATIATVSDDPTQCIFHSNFVNYWYIF